MLATSFDVQILGQLPKQSPGREADHFIIVYVDGNEVLRSDRTPREPPPHWKVLIGLRFDLSSTIRIVVYRRSLSLKRVPLKKNFVAEYSGLGIELLDKDIDHELVDMAGHKVGPSMSIQLDLEIESHTNFMKTVDEDVARLTTVKGADAADTVTTIAGNFATVLQTIIPIVDDLASAHPLSNAAWIMLSSAYKILQNQAQEDSIVGDMVESLREMAGAASSCPNLPEIGGTINVVEEIGRCSLEAARIVHDYAAPSIRGKASIPARAAKHQLSDMSTRVSKCQKRCLDLTEILRGRVQLDTNTRVRGIQDAQKEDKIETWMGAPDTSPNYNAAREKHQPETGSWFLGGPTFATWKEHPDFLLWLHGGPGCGKTVLCAAAIQHIIDFCDSKLSTGYAYFLFDGRSAETALLVHEKMIRSIIMQLARRCDGIPTALVEMYEKCDRGLRQPSIKFLQDCLSRIMEAFDRVYVIIDSLDECSERKEVVQWIQSMVSGGSGKLHMLATSRLEPEITRGLGSLSNLQEIGISGQQTEADVRRFLNARLAESDADKWTEAQKDMMKEALIGGADGMFRWVALQIDRLMKCRSELDLEKQLKSLPRDLNETYCRILAESPDPGNLKRFLQWLAFSSRMMTTEEIAEVAVIDFGENDAGLPVFDLRRRYQYPRDVLGVCYGLVTEVEANTENISWRMPKAIRALKLAHFSVKEYLISEQILSGAAANFHTDEQLSHDVIVQTSLAYLLHFNRPDSITADNLVSFPLAEYAAEHWITHFHASSPEHGNTAIIQQLTVSLFQPSPFHVMYNWLCLHNPEERGRAVNFRRKSGDLPPPLYYACVAGSIAAVENLIVKGGNINATGGRQHTALIATSSRGYHEIVELLLRHGADVNAEGGDASGTALRGACLGGHLDIVELLLKHGADVNAKGGEHSGTALQAACSGGHLDVVQLLLMHGADVNDEGGEYLGTALQGACSGGHLDAVQLLLKHGADVNPKGGRYSGTALQAACSGGHLDVIQLLLTHGADINAEGGFGSGTALQEACSGGHLDVVQLLWTHGAIINAEGGFGSGTALQEACSGGHLEVVQLLLTHGAIINAEGGFDSSTALQEACSRGHLDIVQLLLTHGAIINVEGDVDSGNALQTACSGGHLEIVQLLLKHGGNVNVEGGFGSRTALQAACWGGHLEMVQLLLKHSADINAAATRFSGTALQAACSGGHLDVIQLLLNHGADVNARGGEYSGTALQVACSRGHLDVVQLLLTHGAVINVEGGFGSGTALQGACYRGHLGVVQLLLQHGAAINAEGSERSGTALQAASYMGSLEVVQLLLDHGADVTAEGKGDWGTALQMACSRGHLNVIQLLLKHGAVINAEGTRSSSAALQAACSGGHLNVVQLLLKHGAVVTAEGKGVWGTVLREALDEGHLEIVKLLQEHGAVLVEPATPTISDQSSG